jgi:hypothetical protein
VQQCTCNMELIRMRASVILFAPLSPANDQ